MKKIATLILLLFASWTHAGIVVTDIEDVTFPFSGDQSTLDFDFNGDGETEFTFEGMWGMAMCYFEGADTNFWTVGGDAWMVLKSLEEGTLINADATYAATMDVYINPGGEAFFPQGDSYFGVKFKLNGNWHYGWVLVNLEGEIKTFKSYAYNDVPNEGINAGDEGTMAVPGFDKSSVSFYPNPASESIIFATAAVKEVTVADTTGKITGLTVEGSRADVSRLQPGIYFISAITEEDVLLVSKLVKL